MYGGKDELVLQCHVKHDVVSFAGLRHGEKVVDHGLLPLRVRSAAVRPQPGGIEVGSEHLCKPSLLLAQVLVTLDETVHKRLYPQRPLLYATSRRPHVGQVRYLPVDPRYVPRERLAHKGTTHDLGCEMSGGVGDVDGRPSLVIGSAVSIAAKHPRAGRRRFVYHGLDEAGAVRQEAQLGALEKGVVVYAETGRP